MILPLGDQPNPKGTPWVTYLLIAANVMVFVLITLPLSSRPVDPGDPRLREYLTVIAPSLSRGVSVWDVVLQTSLYDLLVFSFGYRPSDPSFVTLLTSMFLHAGFLHLFGNMLFLWIYGDNVEHRLGPIPYLGCYLLTGAVATLFHAFLSSKSPIPLVGASGAISGVLGFYFLWFPRNKVRLWVLFFPFFMEVILVPARWVLGFYLVVDNLLPFAFGGGSGGGVAHGAHIGGFVGGLIVAWFLDRRDTNERPAGYEVDNRSAAMDGSIGRRIGQMIRAGDFEEGAKIYFSMSPAQSRRVLDPEDSIALGEWLARSGQSAAALTVFQRHLRDFPRGPGIGEAHAFAGLIQLNAFTQVTPAYQHLVEALDYELAPGLEDSVREALARITRLQKFQVRREDW